MLCKVYHSIFYICRSILILSYRFIVSQVYFAARLDLPHYHVAADKLQDYLSEIASFRSKNKARKDSFEVLMMDKHSNHESADLNVFNQLTEAMQLIAKRIPLKKLANEVHLAYKEDKSRGNKYIDVGFSSDINTKRGKKHGGVSMPQELVRSTETIFESAMLAMTEMCDLVCQPELKGKVFRDEERNELFAGSRITGNRIEALRVALTNGKHLVAIHVDDKNDVLAFFRGVINYSEWILIEGEWW